MSDDATIIGPFHLISTAGGNPKVCKNCGAGPEKWEIRNYDMLWRDGEIYCQCGQYIRMYDAG